MTEKKEEKNKIRALGSRLSLTDLRRRKMQSKPPGKFSIKKPQLFLDFLFSINSCTTHNGSESLLGLARAGSFVIFQE